jgi:UDP-N-acetylmuramoyl-L-alanyl-D-glutamate--2,6-diaminopimelate ligase
MSELSSLKIFPVACHTDNVSQGGTFVVIKGMKQDGISYVPQALEKGAKIIVVQEEVVVPNNILEKIKSFGASLKRVSDSRLALSNLSAAAFDYPAKKLKIVAITGTKGKTTTTFLIEQILKNAGFKTALLSTVKNSILSTDYSTSLTTQQPDYLHAFFNLCVRHDVEWVVMEVAAQAFSLHRVADINFDVGIFTNFSQEHAEFYKNNEEYFLAKKSLINHLKPGAPLVLNADDEKVRSLASFYKNSFLFTCKSEFNNEPNNSSLFKNKCNNSCENQTNCTCRNNLKPFQNQVDNTDQNKFFNKFNENLNSKIFIKSTLLRALLTEIDCRINYQDKIYEFRAPLTGSFNLANISAAFLCTKFIGVAPEKIINSIEKFAGVPGRMNKYILPNRATAFIDYAHTPSSYEAVFSTLRPLVKHLIVIFGAGGDRDPIKRPQMGQIASKYCDLIILTTDNPRSEEPENIIKNILAGIPQECKNVLIELDREKAIKLAYKKSSPDSVILILGKGPDEYQLIKGVKTRFSEKEILNSF